MNYEPPTKSGRSQFEVFVSTYVPQRLLLKVAMRCDIKCTYCYWFRDPAVYDLPPLMTLEVENALFRKLNNHINKYQLKAFTITFHGGEPLLWGKRRFVQFCSKTLELELANRCEIRLSIQTNGIRIDEEWAALFRIFRVNVSLSIDGPIKVHDTRRVDFQGRGTLARVVQGIERLRREGINPSVLAVCEPKEDPDTICKYLVEELNITWFDILIPDHTYDEIAPSIADFYIKLFDIWYDKLANKGITVRSAKDFCRAVLGRQTESESIGRGPVTTFSILTDGSFEVLDVLKIRGSGGSNTNLNILHNELDEINRSEDWLYVLRSSLELGPKCKACALHDTCGGGYIPSRWSSLNGFANPSVYCSDLKRIYAHVAKRIFADLLVTQE